MTQYRSGEIFDSLTLPSALRVRVFGAVSGASERGMS